MHIQYLLGRELRGSAEMELELGKLPEDLRLSYRGFVNRIRQQSEGKKKTAERVFRWLLALSGSFDRNILIAATC